MKRFSVLWLLVFCCLTGMSFAEEKSPLVPSSGSVRLVLWDLDLVLQGGNDYNVLIVIGNPTVKWYGDGGNDTCIVYWLGGHVNLDVRGGDDADCLSAFFLCCSGSATLDTDAGSGSTVFVTNVLSSVQTTVLKLVGDPDPVVLNVLSPGASVTIGAGTADTTPKSDGNPAKPAAKARPARKVKK